MEGDDGAKRVVEICEALERDVGAAHRARWYMARSMYEGRDVVDESSALSAMAVGTETDVYNLSRSAVDTANAEIAARQRPKPMFLTTGADWRTKRKAKKWDRFVEGILTQRQGDRYADWWELTEDLFRDAECAVGGVGKVSVDRNREKIVGDRIPAYELLVDPHEARSGRIRNWFHVYPMDLDLAEETFASEDDKELSNIDRQRRLAALASSTGHDHSDATSPSWRATQTVKIFEAWYISPIAGKPGKHVFACRGGLLHEEDWEWPRAPFFIIRWSKEPFGIWGTGLVECGAKQHEQVNDMEQRLHTRMKLNAVMRTYYNAGMVKPDDLGKNDAEVFIPVKDMAQAPRTENVPPVTGAEVEYVATKIQRYYDFQGISQMSASQRKEPGVDAAIAMQTLNDIKSVRSMPQARAYELIYVDVGELIVYAARDLAKTNPGFTAKWFGDKRQYQEYRWKDIDMDATPEVRVAPVSAMSRDPAQRLQIVEQLVNMGFLSREKYLELIGLPDLDSVLQMEGSETQWVEKMCDRYLDADDDAELEELGGFQEPDGYLLQPLAALVTVAQHYFDAMVNDVPEYQAELLRRFMASLQRIIQRQPGQAAAAGAAPAQPVQALTPPIPGPAQMGAAA